MTSGTLITLAPTGAESAKADVPALPVTVDEVVAAARDCQAIGAAVIHLHVRGEDTRPTLDLGRCREVAQGQGLQGVSQRANGPLVGVGGQIGRGEALA